jgi:Flp pilus assembly pilin Flp
LKKSHWRPENGSRRDAIKIVKGVKAMMKFFNNEDGSATIQYGLVLALVSVMMLGGLVSLHNNLPTDINKLNVVFAQHR